MWADKRFKEPWLLNYFTNDDTVSKKKVQGLHILKKLSGPKVDGSEIKLVTDGKLSVHGIFTEKAIKDFQTSSHRNDDTLKEWDKCLIIVRKYSLNHYLHESVFGCKFELVIDDFSYWVSEEGFRLKEDPEYCMDVEIIRKKSQKLWELWKLEQVQAETSEYSAGGSVNLSQLLNELAKDSQASIPVDSLQIVSRPDHEEKATSSQNEDESELDVSEKKAPLLSKELFDVRRFVIQKKDEVVLNNISEWQVGYRVPVSSSMKENAGSSNRNINSTNEQLSNRGQHEHNHCNISVQVGESLLEKNVQGSHLERNEQFAQVGESLFASSLEESRKDNQQEETENNLELPSNIIFHPLFLPDDSQANTQDAELPAPMEIEPADNMVASTQIPHKHSIPLPDFPLSPVKVSPSWQRIQNNTGIEKRSFITQTTKFVPHQGQSHVLDNKTMTEVQRSKEETQRDQLITTTCAEFKTCLQSPENKGTQISTSEEHNFPPVLCINKEGLQSSQDNDERNVLSGLAQQVPSSGESITGINVGQQGIHIVDSNEQERLQNLYTSAVEVLELSDQRKDNFIKEEKSFENEENIGSKINSIKHLNGSEKIDDTFQRNSVTETNPPLEKPVRRSRRSKSENSKSKLLYDEDELFDEGLPNYCDKQQKSQRQKSAQKSRYSFNKTKSVAENIQGMLSTEKKGKFDSSVLFDHSSLKSVSGKKKRLSTRKKLYSDNMLMCGVPSDSDTRISLPSVTEEAEMTQEQEVASNENDHEVSDRSRAETTKNIATRHENIETVNIKTQPINLVQLESVDDGGVAPNNNNNGINSIHNSVIESSSNEICPVSEDIIPVKKSDNMNSLDVQPVVVLEPLLLGNVKTDIDQKFTITVSNVSTGVVTSVISITSDNSNESNEIQMQEESQFLNFENVATLTDIKAETPDTSVGTNLTNKCMDIIELNNPNNGNIDLKISAMDISCNQATTRNNSENTSNTGSPLCSNRVKNADISQAITGASLQSDEECSKLPIKIAITQPTTISENNSKSVDKGYVTGKNLLPNEDSVMHNDESNNLIPRHSKLNVATTYSTTELSNQVDILQSKEAQNIVQSCRNVDVTSVPSSFTHTPGEMSNEVSKGSISSSLPCAQVHHQDNVSNERLMSDEQIEADGEIGVSTLNSDEDPDEEILYKVQSLFEKEEINEDDYNLLHIDFKDNTKKAVQAYFVDT